MDMLDDLDVRWTWRNCRSLWLSVGLVASPWDWHFGRKIWDSNDYTMWKGWFSLGPIEFEAVASTGNSSSEEPWRAKFALSDGEAWGNAVNAARRRKVAEEVRALDDSRVMPWMSRFHETLLALLVLALVIFTPAALFLLGYL